MQHVSGTILIYETYCKIIKFELHKNNDMLSIIFLCSCPRYGSEDKLATLMGVMQALVSFVQVGKNTIR